RASEAPSEDAPNVWWSPFVSYFLPGFDQWWEGQYPEAATYTGVAAAGHALFYEQDKHLVGSTGDPGNATARRADLALNMYTAAGGFSAYESFRSAAARREKSLGEYQFLTHDESPGDLLAAP